MIHCFKALQSDLVLWITWFRLSLQSTNCESFDSDRDFGADSWIIWFRLSLQSTNCESFDSDRDFGADSWIIWFRLSLQSTNCELFDSDRDFGADSWIIWFRLSLQSTNCESFDSDRDFEQIRESFHELKDSWFAPKSWSEMMVRESFNDWISERVRESFDSDQNLGAHMWIIFRSGLWSLSLESLQFYHG